MLPNVTAKQVHIADEGGAADYVGFGIIRAVVAQAAGFDPGAAKILSSEDFLYLGFEVSRWLNHGRLLPGFCFFVFASNRIRVI